MQSCLTSVFVEMNVILPIFEWGIVDESLCATYERTLSHVQADSAKVTVPLTLAYGFSQVTLLQELLRHISSVVVLRSGVGICLSRLSIVASSVLVHILLVSVWYPFDRYHIRRIAMTGMLS